MIALPRTVVLREEHDGDDHRYLTAVRTWRGKVFVRGQDLGPSTAMVSPDGEYEWAHVIPPGSVRRLRRALGVPWHTDLMSDLATRWTGPATYELERRLGELHEVGDTYVVSR
jgi:hypothetical protein